MGTLDFRHIAGYLAFFSCYWHFFFGGGERVGRFGAFLRFYFLGNFHARGFEI